MGTSAVRIDRLERNALINGAFDYNQRAGTAATNTSGTRTYILDRWLSAHTGTYTGTPNVRRHASSPDQKTQWCLRHDFRRNAASGTLTHEQRIESLHAVELVQSGKMSVSFKVNSPVAGATAQIIILQPTALDTHTSQTTLLTSGAQALTQSAWTEVKFENQSISTSQAANGLAIQLVITLPSATDGSDQSMLIAQAIANSGAKASSFVRAGRSAQEELMLCQRYYEKTYDTNVATGTSTTVGAIMGGETASASYGSVSFPYKVQKRIIPTIFAWDEVGNGGATGKATTRSAGGMVATNNLAVSGQYIGVSNTSIWVSNTSGAAALVVAHFSANAEIN
jgi:hypothetical protein